VKQEGDEKQGAAAPELLPEPYLLLRGKCTPKEKVSQQCRYSSARWSPTATDQGEPLQHCQHYGMAEECCTSSLA
jgi:hypothetical protein